ncbi:MAG: sugar-binding domain-containing protein [Tepidisphaeraceae bacterium]|jgi:beta-mannosidase
MNAPRDWARRGLAILLLSLAMAHLVGCAGWKDESMTNGVTLSDGWVLQDAAKVQGDGPDISKPNYMPESWYKATVPGTVLTSLVNDGVYPEPLYGENNRPDKIPESLARATYWYRTQFTPPPHGNGEHVWLHLEGINYIASVWVNGNQVGQVKGAFARGTFDITPFLRGNDPAGLAIEILPPPNPGDTHEKTQAAGTGPNGGILAQDGPTFLCSIGWDWIPTIRDRNVGLWQKVWLNCTGGVVVENPLVTSTLPLPRVDSADLTIVATVRNVTDSAQSGVLSGQIEGRTFSANVSLAAGESKLIRFTALDTPSLHIQNPRLWWPNGFGKPELYSLHLEFTQGGAVSDAHDITFGIRTMTYHVSDSPNLTLSVNGVPIICKGGDWGMDEAMKRSPRERLEAQIRMHQLANYNMIRNWVGQSTSEDFYDLCDRYGILVWDEFFQPNPSDGPNPTDADLYLANVREKVLRFRNHPCIALWCARNEGNPPARIDAGIQKIMSELEPQRLYQKNSNDGRGVRSGGPYSWRAPRAFYTFPATEAFKTEIGSVSIPTLQAVQAMLPEKDWDTINDAWAEHDLCRGAQEGRGVPAYSDTINRRYGPVTNLADFVRKSQLANYEAFRAMYEGRFAKLFHPVTGVLTWMSNPAQPSMVWQLYSHDLEPNSSLFAVEKACEPLHIQMNQSDFHVMVINDQPAAQSDLSARIAVFNLDGTKAMERELPATAAPSAATDLGVIEWPTGLSPVHFIKLELRDAAGKVVSDNFYWRTLKTYPTPAPTSTPTRATTRTANRPPPIPEEDFRDLQTMPTAAVSMTVVRRDAGDKCLLDATLANTGANIALMAHLQLRRAGSGERVLPVYYSDNYVSLLPGESKTITIEAARKDLHGDEPKVFMDGWNVQ